MSEGHQSQIPWGSPYLRKDTFFCLVRSDKICVTQCGFKIVQGRSSWQGRLCLFGHIVKVGCLTIQVKTTNKNIGPGCSQGISDYKKGHHLLVIWLVALIFAQVSKPDILGDKHIPVPHEL